MKILERLFGNEGERIKKQLLNGKLKQVEIEGTKFYIRRLSAHFIFALQGKQKEEAEEALYSLVAAAVVDRKGQPVFTAEEAKGLNVFVLNSLIVEAMDYNALNPDSVDKARDQLKNLQTQDRDASTTS
jgi:hypothetical protein